MNTENEKDLSMPRWVLVTLYFKYENGKQKTLSCLFRLESESIKETIQRWRNFFGDENDFFIHLQVITAFNATNAILLREDADEQKIKELLSNCSSLEPSETNPET